MKRFIIPIFLFLGTIHNTTNAQIVISEVHYDSKFIEYMYNENLVNQKHHLGEYIELYNYTTEDIPLKNWRLASNLCGFVFPDNAVIKSGDYVVVAYGDLPNRYFRQFYPTVTADKESKIFYSGIILNNLRDNVDLYAGDIRGRVTDNSLLVSSCGWQYHSVVNYDPINQSQISSLGDWDGNFVFNSSTDYYNNSIHYELNAPRPSFIQLSDSYMLDIANPFGLLAPIPLVPFESIDLIQEYLNNIYATYTWNEIVTPIKNRICPLAIPDIYQTDNNTYQTNGRCFTYDLNGNNDGSTSCIPPTITNPTLPNSYTDNEIAAFDALISIAPNPSVTANTTVNWSGAVVGKISTIFVANTSGQILYTYTITNSQTSQSINLGMQTGIYIVRIQLDSSQFISRNIIKT